ncbi:hypothetical protein SDC9_108451 [bioreactor metagenome]|uniref:Uncharacterized protein n=1 Tax=bioreactor metagenome TaxID=1076179 RepID=A0A645BAB6_9ZZZZ
MKFFLIAFFLFVVKVSAFAQKDTTFSSNPASINKDSVHSENAIRNHLSKSYSESPVVTYAPPDKRVEKIRQDSTVFETPCLRFSSGNDKMKQKPK